MNTYAIQPLIQPKVPILKIQAQNMSPQEIGLEIGRQSKIIFPDIESRYDQHLAKVLNQTQFKYLLEYKLPALLKKIDINYYEEIKGVSASWVIIQHNKLGDGFLSMDEYLILNFLANLGLPPNSTGFSAFGKAVQGQYSIIGRNMDWGSTAELRSLQAITIYYYKNNAIVNIGFSGLVSILTGFNDQGLFLNYSNAESYSPYAKYHYKYITEAGRLQKKVEKTVFDLRKALETTNNVSQATHYLSKKNSSNANNIFMADINKVQVLEFSVNQRARVRRWNSATQFNKNWTAKQQIAVISCNILALLPDNCRDSKNRYHWHRLAKLAQFSPENPAERRDISKILFDTQNDGNEIFNTLTLNSVIFIPKTKELYFYAAPVEVLKNMTRVYQPIHQAYLNLLPPSKSNESKDNIMILLKFIILVLVLIIILFAWIYKIPEKFRKNKIINLKP
jgi:hypothetical protein